MTARICKVGKKMRRATARRAKLCIPLLGPLAAVPFLLAGIGAARAQSVPATDSPNPLALSGLEIFSGKSTKVTAATPGTGLSEVLRGNGSRVGYKLTHGNVIADTVRVRASGQSLRLDTDFWIDSASGSIIFAQAVRPSDSISVYYRYLEGPAASAGSAMPGLKLNFGAGASLGLLYNTLAGDGSGLDTSMFGLAMGGKLGGSGLAQFNGLAYFSQTKLSTNLVNSAAAGEAKAKTGAKPGMDHLIAQNFAVNSGKLQFHADYQDVGKDFAAFQSLKATNATNKSVLDQLTALEGEKGVKRLGFGLNLANDLKSKTPNGLALQWNRIEDGKGAISQESIGFNSRDFHFSYAARDVNNAFTKFKGLREADKTVWEKEKGLSTNNLGFGFNLATNKQGAATGAFDYSSQQFKDKSGSLSRSLVSLSSGTLGFSMLDRRADLGFTRIADLADADKNLLALDTRRMYDPNAKIEQVTQKDRDQLAKESGIERTNLRGQMLLGKAGKAGALTFSQFNITDNPAKPFDDGGSTAVQGTLLNYTDRKFQLSFAKKTIGSDFNRMADLTDLDRQQLGNARGLSTQSVSGVWAINKASKLTFSSLDVGGSTDAISAAIAVAQKTSQDSTAARKTAQSGLNRFAVALESPGLNLSASQSHTDQEFARAGDLPIPDADKHQIETERGTKRSDYALHFAKVKGIVFDGDFYNATGNDPNHGRDMEKINSNLVLAKKTSLLFQSNKDLTTVDGKQTGNDHSLITFNQEIGKSFLLSLIQDKSAVYDNSTPTPQSARTDAFHFETPKTKPNNLNFDVKKVAYFDGHYENTSVLNVHAKPSSNLAVNYSRTEIDRGQGTPDPSLPPASPPAPDAPVPVITPSEATDALDFQWQTTKQFAVVFGFSQLETSEKKQGDTVSIGLKGDPVKNVTMTAKFDEVHTNSTNTKDVADFAFSNAKPFKIGCVQDLSITARYASLNDKRKLQNETMSGRATWKVWKNEFLLDYGGLTKENGEITIARVYSFKTDPNPKKAFHGEFYYKSRTMVDGTERLIRRFSSDWRLNKKLNFTYTFGTLPEDDKGTIQPQSKADVELKYAPRTDMTCEAFYRNFKDDVTKKLTRSLGFGIEGKLNRRTKMALAYSLDANADAAIYDHSNHYHFLLDHQVDSDHFITLSTDIRSHDGKDLKDETRANLDFRYVY